MNRLNKLFGGTLSRTKTIIEKPDPNGFHDAAGSPDGVRIFRGFFMIIYFVNKFYFDKISLH